MVLHLVKKDILIAKKFVFVAMLVVIAVPLLIMLTAPSIPGFLPFLYMVVIGELLLLQAISQEEAKYPKAVALLCAAPYTRSAFVKAKYIFFILIFAYCCVVNTLLMLVINKQPNSLDLTAMLAVLLVSVIIYGIYMPIEFKYGLVKAKFVFMIAIFAFSLGPTIFATIFANFFANITIDFSALAAISSGVKNIVLALASIAVFGISMMVSTKIFSKKEL